MDDDLDWWKKCPWRIGMHARVTSPDVLKEWRDRLGTVVGIMGHEVKLELEGDGRPMIWIRKSDVAPTTIESPPPAPAPGETRFRAALEEIVSGVYATGKNPRDIAYRVLRGAVPVQASPDDVCDCYDDGVGPVTGPKCKARGWCNGITGAPQRSASASTEDENALRLADEIERNGGVEPFDLELHLYQSAAAASALRHFVAERRRASAPGTTKDGHALGAIRPPPSNAEVVALRKRQKELKADRDEWKDLAQQLRVRESRMSGILCDLSDVLTDPLEGMQELAEHYRNRRLESARPDLFRTCEAVLSSGGRSSWKVECDALTDGDIETLAALVASRVPPFARVVGVPRGGLRLAAALERYVDRAGEVVLLVDDVLTTGASMERVRRASKTEEVVGAVIFARGPVPSWVTPLWALTPCTGSAKEDPCSSQSSQAPSLSSSSLASSATGPVATTAAPSSRADRIEYAARKVHTEYVTARDTTLAFEDAMRALASALFTSVSSKETT